MSIDFDLTPDQLAAIVGKQATIDASDFGMMADPRVKREAEFTRLRELNYLLD